MTELYEVYKEQLLLLFGHVLERYCPRTSVFPDPAPEFGEGRSDGDPENSTSLNIHWFHESHYFVCTTVSTF